MNGLSGRWLCDTIDKALSILGSGQIAKSHSLLLCHTRWHFMTLVDTSWQYVTWAPQGASDSLWLLVTICFTFNVTFNNRHPFWHHECLCDTSVSQSIKNLFSSFISYVGLKFNSRHCKKILRTKIFEGLWIFWKYWKDCDYFLKYWKDCEYFDHKLTQNQSVQNTLTWPRFGRHCCLYYSIHNINQRTCSSGTLSAARQDDGILI